LNLINQVSITFGVAVQLDAQMQKQVLIADGFPKLALLDGIVSSIRREYVAIITHRTLGL
jgi:hypothetical protein